MASLDQLVGNGAQEMALATAWIPEGKDAFRPGQEAPFTQGGQQGPDFPRQPILLESLQGLLSR